MTMDSGESFISIMPRRHDFAHAAAPRKRLAKVELRGFGKSMEQVGA
jgi:hypothetical protein